MVIKLIILILIFLAIDFTADPNSATLLNVKNLITYVNRIKSGRVDKFQGIDNVAITYSRYFCYDGSLKFQQIIQ